MKLLRPRLPLGEGHGEGKRVTIAMMVALAVVVGTNATAQAKPPPEATENPQLELPTFTTEVTPNKVKLGEPFAWRITLEHPKDQRVDLEAPSDTGAFELLDTQRRREDRQDRATTTFTLKTALFELGEKQLPELVFSVVTPTDASTLTVPGAKVEGVSSLPPEAEEEGAAFEDIKGLEPVPVTTYRLIYALLCLLAAAAAAYFLWKWWRNRPPAPVPQVPALPLDIRTRNALDELKAANLPAQGQQREFYFRLSEIVRGYLEERYRIEALESTASELVAHVERLEANELPKNELVNFVRESDLVKFARAEANEPTCQGALEFGYALLNRTWPPPPPPPEAPNVPGPHLS